MTNPVIGRFSDHDSVAACVNNLLEAGIRKDDISLMTHDAENNDVKPDSVGIFQKNGDISSEAGGILVGGMLGTVIGSLMGATTFLVPPIGLIAGAGPLMTALCGGILGGAIGDDVVKNMDAPYSERNPIHPYMAALQEGDILCGVETEITSEDKITKIMSKYAASLAHWEMR